MTTTPPVRPAATCSRWAVLCALALLVLPSLVYWNTISHRYGFRDDYPTLREAQTDPHNIVRFVATQGRPFYAHLVIESFSGVERVEQLARIRLFSAALLGLLGAGLFWLLRAQHWGLVGASLVPAIFQLLPGSQVIVAWAIAWPHVLAMLMALGGYACAEHGGERPGRLPRIGWMLAAVLLVAATTLTYQVSTFFYLVPFAGAFVARSALPPGAVVRWGLRHAFVFGAGFALAVGTVAVLVSLGWLETSRRVALESEPLAKLFWFVVEPLRDALALIYVQFDGRPPSLPYLLMLTMVSLVLLAGAALAVRRAGRARGGLWVLALIALPLAAFLPGLASGERLNAFRLALPLTGVLLIFLAASLRELGGKWLAGPALAVVFTLALFSARSQPFALIARPQAEELALIEEAVRRMPSDGPVTFYVRPAPDEAVMPRHYADEFGTLSADGEWIIREILHTLVATHFPDDPPVFQTTAAPPPETLGSHDIIIDFRVLIERRHGGEPAAAS